jgi:hypothetical protein
MGFFLITCIGKEKNYYICTLLLYIEKKAIGKRAVFFDSNGRNEGDKFVFNGANIGQFPLTYNQPFQARIALYSDWRVSHQAKVFCEPNQKMFTRFVLAFLFVAPVSGAYLLPLHAHPTRWLILNHFRWSWMVQGSLLSDMAHSSPTHFTNKSRRSHATSFGEYCQHGEVRIHCFRFSFKLDN